MPERTPAFEAYLKELEKNKKSDTKGKPAKEGKLAPVLDELSADEENIDADSFSLKKSSDEDQEDLSV